jgi:hypothetical protein
MLTNAVGSLGAARNSPLFRQSNPLCQTWGIHHRCYPPVTPCIVRLLGSLRRGGGNAEGICTCRRRWQRRSRGVSAARQSSVRAGQFLRLRVRREVMRAMAQQPASETMLAFCRLKLVRCAMPAQPANPSPARRCGCARQGCNICPWQVMHMIHKKSAGKASFKRPRQPSYLSKHIEALGGIDSMRDASVGAFSQLKLDRTKDFHHRRETTLQGQCIILSNCQLHCMHTATQEGTRYKRTPACDGRPLPLSSFSDENRPRTLHCIHKYIEKRSCAHQ